MHQFERFFSETNHPVYRGNNFNFPMTSSKTHLYKYVISTVDFTLCGWIATLYSHSSYEGSGLHPKCFASLSNKVLNKSVFRQIFSQANILNQFWVSKNEKGLNQTSIFYTITPIECLLKFAICVVDLRFFIWELKVPWILTMNNSTGSLPILVDWWGFPCSNSILLIILHIWHNWHMSDKRLQVE